MFFIRYVTIQLLAYVFAMGGFLLILQVENLGPLIANIIGNSVAGIFAFTAHRSFTFRANEPANNNRQAIKYFFTLALYIPFSTFILSLFSLLISEPIIAKLTADGTCVLLSYSISKKYIFTKLPLIGR